MIDYRHLSTLTNPTTRAQTVAEMFRAEPYVHLSDAILAAQGGNYAGQQVLVMMEAETRDGMYNPVTRRNDPMMRRRFRLRVLCDEWGDPVQPGQQLEWKFNIRARDELGRKYTSRRKQELARQGRTEEYREYHAAIVDADGCITLEFQDASKLLNLHGIHYATGLPISRAKELSGTVKPIPGGGFKHMRNWRYVEVPAGMEPGDVAGARVGPRPVVVSSPDPVPQAAPVAPQAAIPTPAEAAPAPKPKRGRPAKKARATSPVESAPDASADVDDPTSPT